MSTPRVSDFPTKRPTLVGFGRKCLSDHFRPTLVAWSEMPRPRGFRLSDQATLESIR